MVDGLQIGSQLSTSWGIVNGHEVCTEALTQHLLQFLHDKGISVKEVHESGFDGTNTMSGQKSGVQIWVRCQDPNDLFVYCQ